MATNFVSNVPQDLEQLGALVSQRDGIQDAIQRLQAELAENEFKTLQHLIENRMFEFLSINRPRINAALRDAYSNNDNPRPRYSRKNGVRPE